LKREDAVAHAIREREEDRDAVACRPLAELRKRDRLQNMLARAEGETVVAERGRDLG
jgi:hypothetical protein